jgi:hypothetical protein
MAEIFDAEKYNWAKHELLRNISHTRIPVRIRKFTADGPVATCVITWVHGDGRVEVYSEELVDSERFADAGHYTINESDIWSVEVAFQLPKTRSTSEEVVHGPSEKSGTTLRQTSMLIRAHIRTGNGKAPAKTEAKPAAKSGASTAPAPRKTATAAAK